MSTHEQKTFKATYEWASNWRDLPWAHEAPTLFLAEICERRPPGRALDIGCGAGTDSVYLARRGWEVTALDFMARALEYTSNRAAEAGVTVRTVQADITEWAAPGPFDLVLDHGLLHNVDPVRHAAYREHLLRAIGDESDFVLLHWHPRYPGQPDGRMGPHRANRAQILDFFAPELQERFFALEEFEDLPDLVGGGMSQACYWFRRSGANARPRELLAQIKATFRRHGIEIDTLLAAAGDRPAKVTLEAPDLLARLVGPGRLGLSHVTVGPASADRLIIDWAKNAGEDPRMVANLLALFASTDHGGLCGVTPRCAECEVQMCKRLRQR